MEQTVEARAGRSARFGFQNRFTSDVGLLIFKIELNNNEIRRR
jgi:hypothetical protein